MREIIYQDFDLLILRSSKEREYTAVVRMSGGGDSHVDFSADDLQTQYQSPTGAIEDSARRAVKLELDPENYSVSFGPPPLMDTAKAFGARLFEAIFDEKMYLALRRSIDKANRDGAYLRIRLDLSRVPELGSLPWEYLYDTKLNYFYAQSIKSPIVRYLSVDDPIEPLIVDPPLRVLVVVSQPSEVGSLDVEKEWDNLKEAVKELEDNGLLELFRLESATIESLQRTLMERFQDRPFHVFHFIGHGAYDKRDYNGKLLFTGAGGKARPISAERIADELRDSTFRLAVINACEGAHTSVADSYTGTAQSLLRQAGIPAVVAMQFEITDTSAIAFARRFYDAIAKGYPVDAAVTLARKSILDLESDKQTFVEWGTPVLYMRAKDGYLLKVKSPGRSVTLPRAKDEQPGRVSEALGAHYRQVIRHLLEGTLVPFLGLDVNLYGREINEDWKPGEILPSNRELVKYLMRVFEYPVGHEPDLVFISQYAVVKKKGPAELYQVLKDIFGGSYKPTPLHDLLATVPKLLREHGYPAFKDTQRQRFLVVTTNYDNLLETAFADNLQNYNVVSYITNGQQCGRFQHSRYADGKLAAPPRMIDDPQDYPELTDQNPVILKLPGAVEAYEQRFAITEDHYCDYLTFRDLTGLLPPSLKGKLKASHHLFLGSSLRNWSLRALLYRVWEKRQPDTASWAVHPDPQQIDEEFWKASNVEIISARFEDYTAELTERLLDALRSGE